MTEQLIAKKPEPIGIIRGKVAQLCGNCHFGNTVAADLTIIACAGLPPQMIVMGYAPQGPQIALMHPNLPRSQPACALFRERGPGAGEKAN